MNAREVFGLGLFYALTEAAAGIARAASLCYTLSRSVEAVTRRDEEKRGDRERVERSKRGWPNVASLSGATGEVAQLKSPQSILSEPLVSSQDHKI